jgi:hypothetical protein
MVKFIRGFLIFFRVWSLSVEEWEGVHWGVEDESDAWEGEVGVAEWLFL